jgi:hypothetical protein
MSDEVFKYGATVPFSAELARDSAGLTEFLNAEWAEWALDQRDGPRLGPKRPVDRFADLRWTLSGRPAGPYRRVTR